MNLAFDVTAHDRTIADSRRAVTLLTQAIGPSGLTGGQWSDLHALGAGAGAEQVTNAHAGKTGALFAAAMALGAVAAGAAEHTCDALGRAGAAVGLAFQIWDDLLDAKSCPEAIGKDTGRDVGKATLVTVMGAAGAQDAAAQHLAAARSALSDAGLANGRLARYLDAMIDVMIRPLGLSQSGHP
jgi:geranylgeranyl diphosphate synthase type II